MLRRYWFKFAPFTSTSISTLNLGCGVTAHDVEDARRLIEEKVFPIFGVREIAEVLENVDISTLDENHVRPNMGNPIVRGVWFPLI
jgi:hypothetical protein